MALFQLIPPVESFALGLLWTAIDRVEQRLASWLADGSAFGGLLQQVYGPLPEASQQSLRLTLEQGGLDLPLEILSGDTMGDALGAFTSQAPGGGARIYLNASWLARADAEAIEAVLLHELGHAFDQQLKGGADTAGEEGESFAALIRGLQPSPGAATRNDQRQLLIQETSVLVETVVADTTPPRGSLVATAPAYASPSANPFGIVSTSQYARLAITDFDHDGDLDLFIGNFQGNTLLFRNTAAAGATAPAYESPITNPFNIVDIGASAAPAFADIDLDGDLDLFIGNNNGNILVFRNTTVDGDTTPAFASPSTNPFGITDVGYVSVPCFADADADGDLDLFIGEAFGNTLFFRNTALAGATAPAYANPSTNPFGITNVGWSAAPTFADADADGDLDLFIGNFDGDTLFFRNTAALGASNPAYASPSVNPYGISNVGGFANPAFGDSDNDGDLDLFIGNVSGCTLFYLNTAATPVAPVTSNTANGSYSVGSVISLQLEFNEAVIVNTSGGTPRLLLETGNTDRYADYSSGSGSTTLTFTYTVQDGDNSSDLDQASATALELNGGTIRDAAGNNAILTLAAPGANGSLSDNAALVIDTTPPGGSLKNYAIEPSYANPSTNPYGITDVGLTAKPFFADVDGDGDLDLFMGTESGCTLFFRNTAVAGAKAPAFASPSTNPFGLTDLGRLSAPALVDADRDGDLDLFIAQNNGITYFYRNTATAGATAPVYASALTNPFGLTSVGGYSTLAFADIDNDGDLDLFVGETSGFTIFFRNTATASATTPAYASAAVNPFGIIDVGQYSGPALADADGDGDLDLFIGSSNGNTFVFRNTAAAGSSDPAYSSPTINPYGITDVGDFARPTFFDSDGDGDLDLYIGNNDGCTLFFRNTADTTIAPVTSSTANGLYSVGAVISLQLEFNEAVIVETSGGTPRLRLETGSIDRYALYSSGSGSTTLTFSYTVQAGDSSSDLDQASANAFELNGGTIRDAAGNNAVFTLAAPGATGSLAANAALVIDTTAPRGSLTATAPAYASPSTNPFGFADVGSHAEPIFADVDADGDLDLLIGNGEGNTLFFRNTAAAGATAPAFASPSTNPFGITDVGRLAAPALVDADRDGDLDLFIGQNDGNTYYYRNTALAGATVPAYASPIVNPFGISDVGGYATPTFADADRDGDLDLFIGDVSGATFFFRNTAAAGATTPIYASGALNPFGITNVGAFAVPALADADGDGDLDLFIGNNAGNTLVFRNTATPGATTPAFASPSTNPFGISDVGDYAAPTFADGDSDGDLDLFIGNAAGCTLFFRNTAATPVAPVTSNTANGSYGIGAAISLQVSFNEAVIVNTSGGTPRLLLETGSIDRYAIYSSGSGTTTLTFTYTVQAGDSSSDLDQASADALELNGGTIRDAAGNNAILTLAAPGASGSLGANQALVIDGIQPRGTLYGVTDPEYTSPSANPFGITDVGYNASPTFADADGDGDLDLFIGNSFSSYLKSILFFRNIATAGANAPVYASPSTDPFGITEVDKFSVLAFADADNDGDLDLFIGNGDGDTRFYLNTATAGAADPAYASPSTNPFGLMNVGSSAAPAFADADRDGDLDLFIGNTNGEILFFRNTATAGASEPAYASPSTNPFGLIIAGFAATPTFADADGDGDLDLFIGEFWGCTIFFRNTAPAGATEPAFASPVTNPFGITDVGFSASPAFADADGDGDLDLFVGHYFGDTYFFRNTASSVVPVTSSTTNGSYGLGAAISLQVSFNEAVIVNTSGGTPRLLLETGDIDRYARYSSGSGTSTLTFTYRVQSGDSSSDLDQASSTALELNGATIRDAVGNDAILTLAAPGTSGSLGSNAALLIDASRPHGSLGSYATAPAYSSRLTNPFGIVSTSQYARLAITDFDHDGDLDLFIGNFQGNTLLFRNTAAAGATAPAYESPITNPFNIVDIGASAAPAFADIDLDGDLDLFIGNNNGNILVFRNTAAAGDTTPAFASPSANPFGITDVGYVSVPCFADADADGDLDLFVGEAFGNTLFFRNTALAGATAPAYANPTTNPFGITNVGWSAAPTFADADADGDLDLFIGNFDGDTLFFRNTAALGASNPAYASPSVNPYGISNVGGFANPAFGDSDNDGDLDLFIGNVSGCTLFYLNTAATTVAPITSTTANGSYGLGTVISLQLEFNEAVIVNTSGGTPRLRLETGSIDRYAIYSSGSGTNTLSFTYTVQAGDSSSDLDQASANALELNGGTIRDAVGNNAILTLAAPSASGSLSANAALVIDTSRPHGSLGSYATAPAYANRVTNPFGIVSTSQYARLAITDFDHDGDLDLFIGNFQGNTLLFRNTAAAGATAPAYESPITNPFNIVDIGASAAPAFADIDLDGDLDLFIGNNNGNILVFRNTAAAGDTTPAFASPSANPFGMTDVGYVSVPCFADADADGDLDLFVGEAFGNTIFFRNTALAGATAPAYANPSTNPFGITNVGWSAAPTFADADADGDLDLFIGNFDGDTLFFRNTAALGGTNPAYSSPSVNPYGISNVGGFANPAFGDSDNDGDLDLFIGNVSGCTLFYLNTAATVFAPVTSSTTNGSYGIGAVISLQLEFNEAVIVDTSGGTPRLKLETGSIDRYAVYSSGSGTTKLSFTYTVQAGDSSSDLDQASATALLLNGGTIRDAAGNDAILTLAAPGASGSLSANAALVIDGIRPHGNLLATEPAYAQPIENPFGINMINVDKGKPAFIDADGDGDLDLFIGDYSGNTIFLRNTAVAGSIDPAFAAPEANPFNITDVGKEAAPAFADFDGDGDLDLLVGDRYGNTSFFLNTAAANATAPAFSSPDVNPFGITNVGGSASPALADVDGDGDLDLFIGIYSGNTFFFRNTAALGASAPAYASPEENAFGITDVGYTASPSFNDADSDGDLDLFIGEKKGNTLFFRNTAPTGSTDPAYAFPETNPFGITATGMYAANAFGDVDADGDLDLMRGIGTSDYYFFRNTTSLAAAVTTSTTNGSYGLGAVISLQVSFNEAVIVDTSGGTPRLLLETGKINRYAEYSSGSGTTSLTFLYTVQPGDTAADLDQASANALVLNGGTIRDAAGNDAILTLAAPGANGSLAANADLVIDSKAPQGSRYNPAYASPITNPFGITDVGDSSRPTFADIDADGDLDLFIGNSAGDTLFFRNTAAAGATDPAFASPSTNPFGITGVGIYAIPSFADADSDGDLDLYIGDNPGNILFFRNTAAAGATDPAYASRSTNPFGITEVGFSASASFADADGDGDLDLFIGEGNGNIQFFRNTAAVGATDPAYASPSTNPFGITDVGAYATPAFGDPDGDGDLDLFVDNGAGNTIFFRNTATAGATDPAFASPTTNPFGIVDAGTFTSPELVDIDADGDLDLFIGNNDGNILFLANTGTPVAPVSSSTTNGSYTVGAVISLQLEFNEAVIVDTTGGTPRLLLETGSTDRYAIYDSGSGTTTLTFLYTVQAGDGSSDLDQASANALELNGGTIRDAAGNDAILTLASPGATSSLADHADLVINSAPVASGTASLTAVLEDASSPTGDSVANLFAATFNDAETNGLAGVLITANAATASEGLWQWSSDGTTWTDIASSGLADATALFLDAGTSLRFLPAAAFNGTPGSLTARLVDTSRTAPSNASTVDASSNGSTTAISAATVTLGTSITALNDAPAGTDTTVSTLEDTAYEFALADFGFSDPDDSPANTLAAVEISTLPGSGTLKLDGTAISAGDAISAADITAGKLSFSPADDANGTGYASFTFQVQDDGGTTDGGIDLDPSANTITVDVSAVNDAPAGTDNAVSTLEDNDVVFAVADFGFSDPDDATTNSLTAVRISTLPADGSLKLNGNAVSVGDLISAVDITASKLVFTPANDANGTAQASFTFQVQDDGGTTDGGIDLDPSANTITIDITAVNDAPAGSDTSVQIMAGSDYVFTAADFALTDPLDTPANLLAGIVVTTLPALGTLKLNSTAVTAGDSISVSDINAGNFSFTPANTPGSSSDTSFTFQVRDDGGSSDGGVDLDSTARTFSFDSNALPTGSVIITPSTQIKTGETITADSSSVADADGIPSSGPNALLIQWQCTSDGSNWIDIAGATGDTLLLTNSLADKQIRAEARYTDQGGTAETVTSLASEGIRLLWNGTKNADSQTGTRYSDSMNGGDGSDQLFGLDGDDFLNGGKGADNMAGGNGNDSYFVDNANDRIVELSGQGYDQVFSSVSYSLKDRAPQVETLTLTGSGDLKATGNDLDNLLIGNNGDNKLDGGLGNDTMRGGFGDDIYCIDSLADVVIEDLFAGTDEILTPFSTVLQDHVEILTLTGSNAVDGTGNNADNDIVGNTAANLLRGQAGQDDIKGDDGNDTIIGGAGIDRLSGGKGTDMFRFNSPLILVDGKPETDTVTDFKIADNDRFQLSTSVFTALSGAAVSGGVLTASAFLVSATGLATTSSQRILYSTNTDLLSYDSDGTGNASPYAFAKLNGNPNLLHSYFQVGNFS